MSEQVVILGGGLQGLVVGERLQSNGYDVTIVEKSDRTGGMCKTLSRKGDAGCVKYDLGPHKFATRQSDAERYFFDKVYRPELVDISSHIYLKGKWFSYPVKVFEIIKKFPYHGIRCGIDFILAHLKGDGRTYKSYIEGRMGTYTYNFVFKDFANKIWGDPQFLDKELARTRVVTPTIFDIISGILFGDKTTFKSFFYPKGGLGKFITYIEEKFDHADGNILFNSLLKSYDGTNLIVSTPNGERQFIDPIVISTIKPRDLIKPMSISTRSRRMDYRDIHLFYYLVDKMMEDTWKFFPDSDILFNRVSRNFDEHMVPEGKEIICVEVTSDENEEIDRSAVDIQFKSMFGINDNNIHDTWFHKLEGVYPIYHLNYEADIERILSEIETNSKVFCIGRHACHNYNNIDHCLIESMELCRVIVSGGESLDWAQRRKDFNWVIVD